MLLLILGVLTVILGIATLAKGEVALSKTRVVSGGRAKIIGGLLIAAMPVSFLVLGAIILIFGDTKEAPNLSFILPLIPLLGLPATGIVLGFVWAE